MAERKEIELDWSEQEEDDDSSSSSESSDSVEEISDSEEEVICISDDENELKRKIHDDSELSEAKRRKPNVNNADNFFFQCIPLYQMRLIVSFLDLNSLFKFSQTCSYLRSEYLMRKEFWQGLEELNFLPSVSRSLVFDSSNSSAVGLGILSNISLPINNFTTLRSFFSIYLEHFPFLMNVTRLVLDFEKYMYSSLEKNDISYVAESFTQLSDLQLLNVKFKDVSKDLSIIKDFLSKTNIKRLKITFLASEPNQSVSLISNQAFNELVSSLNDLESLHFGFNNRSGKSTCQQFSKNEIISIGNQLGKSLKSFGCNSITIEDFVNTFIQTDREEVLPQMEELIIEQINSLSSFNVPSIARNNLFKLVIDVFLTKEANDIQKILKNLPNLQYLNIALSSTGVSSDIKVDGRVMLKSNSLKQLKFSNFQTFFDSNFVQIDLPNIESLELEYFGELMILSELNKLQHLDIKSSTLLSGQLHSLITKCANSLTYLRVRSCSNVRFIHILKDPFSENFSHLRELAISHLKQLEKISIACVGVHLVSNSRIYLQKLTLDNLVSLREFSFELGADEIFPQVIHSSFVLCDGLKSITPESIIPNIETLHYYGNYESPFWNLLSSHFRNMHELRSLKFDLKFTMTHVAAVRMSNMLTGLSNLQEFSLSSKFSTNSFLFNIANKKLREVTISSEQKTDVKFYVAAPLLETLNIIRTSYIQVKSNSLKYINANNCDLRELILQNELNQNTCGNIQSLVLRACQIAEIKSIIPSFTNLKKLAICSTNVGTKFQEILKQLTSLESLTFEESIASIPVVPSLKLLNVTSSIVKKVEIPEGSNLVKMNLSSCPKLSNIKFASKKATLPYLAILDIRNTQLDGKWIKMLITRSPYLKSIRSSGVKIEKDLEKKIRNGNKKAKFD